MSQAQIRNVNGVLLTLLDLEVENKYNVQCTHTVEVDRINMEVLSAVRYLLADRENLRTELADARDELARMKT